MASAGNIMLRARYTDLFTSRLAFLDEILYENFNAPDITYTQAFNVRTSNRAYEEITGITGFGLFDQKTEAGQITYDTLLQEYDKRFTHLTYAKGFQISMEAMDDDLDGAISNAAPALSRSCQTSIETTIWGVLNDAFTGATYTCRDGQALFSNSHPRVGASVQDNLLTGDISQANLESAFNMFDNLTDHRGLPITLEAQNLIIPTELRWITHEILKSELRSNTANNATNALNQVGLNVVKSKYLTDEDAWMMSCSQDQHKVLVYWRMDPVSDHTMDFDTGNMKTKMTYRMSTGPADHLGWVGSAGA